MVLTSQFSEMTSSLIFFWSCFVCLVNFSHWSNFHVIIITGFGVMTISFYKKFTGNPEIDNSPEFCPICGDWCELRIPNLTRTSLIKCYRMLENAMVTAFIVSVLLRENQHEWAETKLPPPPPNGLGLKAYRTVVQI